jgi:MYXO-CTERM domain-containing protein
VQPGLLTTRSALVLAASVLASACSGDPESGFGVERGAIVYGEPSDDADDAVVEIISRISDTSSLQCSGTLIAPNVVLTALHCVTYRDDAAATFTCRADGTLVPNAPRAGLLGAPVPGENVHIFVGATHDLEPDAIGVKVFGSGATQICRGDMAAVVLDRDIGQNFPPLRFGRSVTRGEPLTVIGYGQTEPGVSGGRRRRDVTVVDIGDVGCLEGNGPTPPDTFVVTQGPCHGDSGGPALSEETGALAGVYSLTLGSSCTSIGARNTFSLVASFEDTIREALEFAAQEPVLEPNTGGGAGTSSCSGTGGSGPRGEGSGSRDDATCACRTAGARTQGAFAWAALGLLGFAVARRRARLPRR